MPESSRICVRNNVAVRGTIKITDFTDHLPDDEEFVGTTLREQVEQDDTVVIIGGGYGITTTIAARQTTEVITYEASNRQFERLKETLYLNKVFNNVTLHHSIVADTTVHSNNKYGKSTANMIDPSELPSCDFLQIDCEGAELEILEKMSIRPDKILVETHGFIQSTEEKVTNKLKGAGYTVIDRYEEKPESGIIQLLAKTNH